MNKEFQDYYVKWVVPAVNGWFKEACAEPWETFHAYFKRDNGGLVISKTPPGEGWEQIFGRIRADWEVGHAQQFLINSLSNLPIFVGNGPHFATLNCKRFWDSENKRQWLLRILYKGDKYGQESREIHGSHVPLVEFFNTEIEDEKDADGHLLGHLHTRKFSADLLTLYNEKQPEFHLFGRSGGWVEVTKLTTQSMLDFITERTLK